MPFISISFSDGGSVKTYFESFQLPEGRKLVDVARSMLDYVPDAVRVRVYLEDSADEPYVDTYDMWQNANHIPPFSSE